LAPRPPMAPASEPLRGPRSDPRGSVSRKRAASAGAPHDRSPTTASRLGWTARAPKRSPYLYRPAEIAGPLARAGNAAQLVEDARSRALRGLARVFGSVGGTSAALD